MSQEDGRPAASDGRSAEDERNPAPAPGRSVAGVDPVLSIVIPGLNEAATLDRLFGRLVPAVEALGLGYEILFVDDGSSDDTLARLAAFHAENPRIKAISLSRNFGKEVALTAGLHHARGQAVVPLDADLQEPPELIGELVRRWREGYDVVYAVRRSRADEGLLKRSASGLFYRLFNRMSDLPIPPDARDLRLLDRRVVDAVNRLPERTRFMKGLFVWVGFRQIGVPVGIEPRDHGRSHFTGARLWRFALDGLTSFTTVPLRVWSYFGGAVAALTMLYAVIMIGRTLIFGTDVPGYASLLVSILFLGGLQLLSLGIIGEYLGRVLNEVKGRPLYIVRDYIGIDAAAPGRAPPG